MKNIQAQYRDLLEGKMSPANFMVNVRRDFPQWVSPVNTFKDAVSILKSKRILNENTDSHDKWMEAVDRILTQMLDAGEIDDVQHAKATKATSNPTFITNYGNGSAEEAAKELVKIVGEDLDTEQNNFDISRQRTDNGSSDSETISEVTHVTPEAIEKALKDMWEDDLIDDMTWKTASKALTHFNVDDHMNMAGTSTADDLAKELVFVATGEHVEDGKYDPGPGEDEDFERDYDMDYEEPNEPFDMAESLNEAAIWNPNAEAPQEVGYDQVNYRQLMKGMEFELSKAPEITDEALVKAKQKALKNLKKDPNFYRNLLIANVEDVDKMDKTLRDTPVKGDNMVDKANAMKVIKKDEKGNVQDTLGKKERAKKKDGEGIKQMTQTPKKVKGVQAFDTPGKEKVMALKEHIMNEFGGHSNQFATPQFSVGSRVESRDGKIVGEIIEFDNHTATVKVDGKDEPIHVQPNILKHSDTKPGKQDNPLAKMPDLGKAGQSWLSKQVKEDSVMEREDETLEGGKATKLANLKEKLMKAIKEKLYTNVKTKQVQSFDPSDPATKDPQFNSVFKPVQ